MILLTSVSVSRNFDWQKVISSLALFTFSASTSTDTLPVSISRAMADSSA
jgi:hypothetical protein